MKSIILSICVASAVLLSGCDKTTGTFGGAAVGTGLGAAYGSAFGSKGTALGAVIGGLAGAAIGSDIAESDCCSAPQPVAQPARQRVVHKTQVVHHYEPSPDAARVRRLERRVQRQNRKMARMQQELDNQPVVYVEKHTVYHDPYYAY